MRRRRRRRRPSSRTRACARAFDAIERSLAHSIILAIERNDDSTRVFICIARLYDACRLVSPRHATPRCQATTLAAFQPPSHLRFAILGGIARCCNGAAR